MQGGLFRFFIVMEVLDDIEDIIGKDTITLKNRYENKTKVVPRSRKREKKSKKLDPFVDDESRTDDVDNIDDGFVSGEEVTNKNEENFVPGSASVYVKTWGCAHNSSDGEYMAGQLAAEVGESL